MNVNGGKMSKWGTLGRFANTLVFQILSKCHFIKIPWITNVIMTNIKYLLLVTFYCSYCSWASQGKNTEVVCHSLLQWTTFCQNSPQ